MKRFSVLLFAVILILCSCGTADGPEGTYAASDGDTSLSVIMDDGYCLIDAANEQNGKTASAAVGGKYTLDNDTVVIEITEGELKGQRFEFLYNESKGSLTNTSDNTVYEKQTVKDEVPDGMYAYKKDSESYVLTIDGESCTLEVHSVNKNGEEADAVETGKVDVSGNTVEIKMDDKNYKFIYAAEANVLMDTSDGRMYEETETED